ncbi:membrane protein [Fervidicella metallireducens AeB]|uniref:Membrane protein n=1 Tax=Fervidicella metallireducens AeB TaxID=1403537 RepID=A0A017RTV4_9CLOT|nr:membrane protein [Fervidicella metallireducens]EYE88077.1 membrane protein [Fervidicella metallireducens AeB]
MSKNEKRVVVSVSKESYLWLIGFIVFFGLLGNVMGMKNMFNTLMSTAHDLLLNTVFYIMAIAVIAGAVGALLVEFGVISLINKVLSPLMKPLYDMPGAASVGVLTTYLSDNPAIISLAKDKGFVRYFKKYQIPALTNIGTAFGMGLIVTTFMIGQAPSGQNFLPAAVIGNVGAIIGSIVSVRLMLRHTKKAYGTEAPASNEGESGMDVMNLREIRQGSVFQRALEAILDGGKTGVDMGLSIIPGVLVICTLVMMLTNGPAGDGGVYIGAKYEGVPVLPWIGQKLSFILEPLLGFKHAEAIAFPVTALGAVGAAIGLVPNFIKSGLIGANEIAVFTAMGMCWSGYLSTHVAMMDSLDARELTNKAILSHTIGGLAAGISAHFIYMLYTMIF